MEKAETAKPDAKPEPAKRAPRRTRVARCIECSYEWISSNGNAKKPSRCPLCKSRDVKWRDECDGTEISKRDLKAGIVKPEPPAPTPEPEPQTPEPEPEPEPERAPEPVETPKPKPKKKEVEKMEKMDDDYEDYDDEEFTFEDAKNALPSIPMQSIVVLMGIAAAAAAVWFLMRKGILPNPFSRKPAPQPQTEPKKPQPVRYYNLPGLGGGLR